MAFLSLRADRVPLLLGCLGAVGAVVLQAMGVVGDPWGVLGAIACVVLAAGLSPASANRDEVGLRFRFGGDSARRNQPGKDRGRRRV